MGKLKLFRLNQLEVCMNNNSECLNRMIQTRENNGENTNALSDCFCPLFSSVSITQRDMSSRCLYVFSNK